MQCPGFRAPARVQLVLWLSEIRRIGPSIIEKENDPDAMFVYSQLESLCEPGDLNGLLDALQERLGHIREWQLFHERYPVLICPVSAELPFPDLLDVESPEAFQRCIEAQLTQVGLPLLGLPGLTVSPGLSGRSPVGVQLVAGRFEEELLFRAAEDIEARGVPPSPVDPEQP